MSNNAGGYILWITSWYPNKLEPYNGDFIQRHARAVALYEDVHLIHIVRDSKGVVTRNILTDVSVSGRLTETIIYYYQPHKIFKPIERLRSYLKYISIANKTIATLFKNAGEPSLIKAYISFKAGIIARRISRKYKIPYVVAEQWTIYLPEAKPSIDSLSFIQRNIFKSIFRDAAGIMVVSEYLGHFIQKAFQTRKPFVIANVVDTSLFKPLDEITERLKFVHISTLNYQKDPEAIIEAFSILKEKGINVELDIIGPRHASIFGLVEYYGLTDLVHLHDEMPQTELVYYVQRAAALVLYSRYETFGCVIIEANACGTPVIVSNIPVMYENVKQGFNGIFVEKENAVALAEKIEWFIKNEQQFRRKEIAAATKKTYNYEKVGKEIYEWYKKMSIK